MAQIVRYNQISQGVEIISARYVHLYRGSSTYAIFITAIFQNFPDTYLAYACFGG